MDKHVKAVFPVMIHTGDTSISDHFEEVLTLEEAAKLVKYYKKRIPLQQCKALAGVCSRIEESAVYRYALYESDSMDTMDSLRVDIMYPVDFPIIPA